MVVRRDDVYLCALDPTIGSEIKKPRPSLVISPDELNQWLRTVIAAPMTSKGKIAPFRAPLTFQGTQGMIVLDQIRTVDRRRLVRRLGAVRDATLLKVLNVLQGLFER